MLTCALGGALLKELVTGTKRYHRSEIPPWREVGEDGHTTLLLAFLGALGVVIAGSLIAEAATGATGDRQR